jgi:hypothetical protein
MIDRVFTTQEEKVLALLKGDFDFGLKEKWALISLYRTPDKPIIKNDQDISILYSKNCQKVLSVCFGDYTYNEYVQYQKIYKSASNHINIITKAQANLIVRFIKQLKKEKSIKTLVVQCKAGISRSGAVGLYACRYYKLNEKEFLNSGIIKPNWFVYKMLSDVYNPLPLIQCILPL